MNSTGTGVVLHGYVIGRQSIRVRVDKNCIALIYLGRKGHWRYPNFSKLYELASVLTPLQSRVVIYMAEVSTPFRARKLGLFIAHRVQ